MDAKEIEAVAAPQPAPARARRAAILLAAGVAVLVSVAVLLGMVVASCRGHACLTARPQPTSSTPPTPPIPTLSSMSKSSSRLLVVFGDSYSDVGNDLRLAPSSYPSVTFSGGPVWDQYLASSLNRSLLTMAFGSATTNASRLPSLDARVPGVDQQVYDIFPSLLASNGSSLLGANPIYAIYSGINDYLFSYGQIYPPAEVVSYIKSYVSHLVTTHNATRVVLPTLPPLDRIPGARTILLNNANVTAEHFRDCWAWHNGNLTIAAAEVQREHAGAGVMVEVVDVGKLVQGIIDTPGDASHGIANVTATCVEACKGGDGDRFLWHDAYHLTSRAHELVAAMMMRDLVKTGFV
ncbi:hypothetical protein HK101_000829 [Irineochytrium annulatum]|nr:hypothetical protein HK101_000829 [Irineochytrium annulatum]